jgi:hypothetical protein
MVEELGSAAPDCDANRAAVTGCKLLGGNLTAATLDELGQPLNVARFQPIMHYIVFAAHCALP